LSFDEAQQTFVTENYLQHGSRNFTAKASKRYPELRVLKYRSSVFYENRFNDALLEELPQAVKRYSIRVHQS